MTNKFVIDYDNRVLTLHYLEQVFMFDLNAGDTGEYWHGFELKDGTKLDINYHQESEKDEPICDIWATKLEDNNYYISHVIDIIDTYEILGNPINYFKIK